MSQETLARLGQAPLWVVVVGGMALAAGCFIAVLIGTSEALPREVLVALRPVERAPDGSFITVDGPPAGVAKGIQLGLPLLLSAMCGSWGLHVWRGLRLKATVVPPTMAPRAG